MEVPKINIPNPIPIINTDDGDPDNCENSDHNDQQNMCPDDSNMNEFRLANQPQELDPYVTPWKPKNKISNFIFCLGSTGLFLAFGGAIMTVTGNVEPVLHPTLAYIGPPALVLGVIMLLSSCSYWMWGLCTGCRNKGPCGVHMATDTAVTTPGVTPTGALDTTGQFEILVPTSLCSSNPGTSKYVDSPLVETGLTKGEHKSSIQSLNKQDSEASRDSRILTKPRSSSRSSTRSESVDEILDGYI